MPHIPHLKRHQKLVRKASAAIGPPPHYRHDFLLLALARSFNATRLGKREEISQFAQAVFYDLGNLANSAGRLEWSRQQCLATSADGSLWMQLAALDIEFALVKIRSIADHLCSLLAAEFASITRAHSRSMNDLLLWVAKNETQIESTLMKSLRDSSLLDTDSWFKHVRMVRDQLVHFGARCEVFPDYGEGIMFQIVGRGEKELIPDLPHLRATGRRVVWWERYFALLWANVAHTQSVLASAILATPADSTSGSFFTCMGLPTVALWLDRLDTTIAVQLSASDDSNVEV